MLTLHALLLALLKTGEVIVLDLVVVLCSIVGADAEYLAASRIGLVEKVPADILVARRGLG